MLHRAVEFAAVAHRDQLRKGTNTPYIAHPCEAALILAQENAPEALLIAALLHDTLEDTSVAPEDILGEFGAEVLGLVCSNSENKSLSWEERKRHTVETLRFRATREEALLALADKLSNLRSIARDLEISGESMWGRFNRGREAQKWYYTSLLEGFSALADTRAYKEFAALVARVFG